MIALGAHQNDGADGGPPFKDSAKKCAWNRLTTKWAHALINHPWAPGPQARRSWTR